MEASDTMDIDGHATSAGLPSSPYTFDHPFVPAVLPTTGTQHTDGLHHDQRDNLSAQEYAAMPSSDATSGDVFNLVAAQSQKYMRIINRLSELGIERSHIALPKAIVIGDQSAGKSSLIEGLSSIKVPRSTGTCTRCPLQLVTASTETPGAPWQCRIYLVISYDFKHAESDAFKYGPWKECPPQTKLFATVDDKAALEDLIRRAQKAILNPDKHMDVFLNAPNIDEEGIDLEFSPNTIKLEIVGPGLPNLSFIDLPGVINQTANNEQPWLVNVVRQLTKDYINQPKSLILLVCSMEGDLANSNASGIMRHLGAQSRCVGVLTKPDRLPEGDPLTGWTRVLNNDDFRVGHGYYVTKQPAQPVLATITSAEARSAERAFFSFPPWSTDFAPFVTRIGTENLQLAVSEKLTELIKQDLPNIGHRVAERIENVERELLSYPEPPHNAHAIIQSALKSFETMVGRSIDGHVPFHAFHDELRKLGLQFCDELRQLEPKLVISTPPKSPSKRSNECIELSSSDEEAKDMPTPSRAPRTPAPKRQKSGSNVNSGLLNSRTPGTKRNLTLLPTGADTPMQDTPSFLRLKLDELREKLDEMSIGNVPGEEDPRALDYLRSQSVKGWLSPLTAYISNLQARLHANLEESLRNACRQWTNTAFYASACNVLAEEMGRVPESQHYAYRLLQNEQRVTFTFNREAIVEEERKAFATLTMRRLKQRAAEIVKEDMSRIKEGSDLDSKLNKAMADLQKSKEADPYESELKAMAKIKAYYNVAAMRFVDAVIMDVQANLLEDCRRLNETIYLRIFEGVANHEEHSTSLLAHDESRENKRLSLKRELENLLAGQAELDALSRSTVTY